MTIRFFVLSAHYRGTVDFSNEALVAAEKGLEKLMNAISDLERVQVSDKCDAETEKVTTTYLEERVRQLTGAASVTALNTGMAAIHYALTAVSAAGLNIVASKHLFGNSVSLLRDTLSVRTWCRELALCQSAT